MFFTNDLQVLARNINVQKPSFQLGANYQQMAQYVNKLWDPYYAAIAHSVLQSFQEKGTFTRLWGHLVTMF